MGGITRREITMVLLAVGALVGWIGGGRWLNAVTVALLAVSLMLLTKVVKWADIAANKEAWSVLVWFATLVALADGLSAVGFLKWFAEHAGSIVTDVPVLAVMGGAVAVYFLVHYLFASITAQTAALMPVFLLAIISVPGVPAKPAPAVLLPRADGGGQSVRHWPGSHLVRKRLRQHQGLLEAGGDHGSGLPGGAAGAGHSLCADLHALRTSLIPKKTDSRNAGRCTRGGPLCTSRR
jgi:hypothetical protein